jgi:hypothetical protein
MFAVVEWGDEVEPSVFLGSRTAVEMAVVSLMQDNSAGDPEWFTQAPTFLTEHPFPSLDDHKGVHDWLCHLHEAMTVPWVSLYTVQTDAGVLMGANPDEPIFEIPEEDA